jgi:hypothetical protein
VLEGADGTWSTTAQSDAGVGNDQLGHPIGIPVYLGDTAAVPVTLQVKASSG